MTKDYCKSRALLASALLMTMALITPLSCNSNKEKPGAGLEFLSETAPISGDTTLCRQSRNVPTFTDIYLIDAEKLEVEVGKQCAISLEGPKCYVDSMVTKVTNGTLFIKYKNIDTEYRKVKVHVTIPYLQEMEVTGCNLCEVTGENRYTDFVYIELKNVNVASFEPVISAKSLTLSLTGTKSSFFQVDVGLLNFKTYHVNNVEISGKAISANFNIDRPDRIDRSRLIVEK